MRSPFMSTRFLKTLAGLDLSAALPVGARRGCGAARHRGESMGLELPRMTVRLQTVVAWLRAARVSNAPFESPSIIPV